MILKPEEVKPTVTRLKRAQGQLAAVIRMLEEGYECEDAITQLAAVAKAIDRAGYLAVLSGMKRCINEDSEEFNEQRLEKLFLSLA